MSDDMDAIAESDSTVGRNQRDGCRPDRWRWRCDAGERGDFRAGECAGINADIVDQAVEKDFVAGLVARADAKLESVVERLNAQGSEAVLGAGGCAVHVAD